MANSRKLQLAPPDLGDDPLFSKLEPRGRIHLSGGEGSFHLQEVLMPDSVRGMPFWLAASVLGLCLLCIGPLDYWVLGVMRRRRWTWLVFPVVALGFTGWMAQLAADHNGRNDARNWLSIVDVTPTGEVLRTTRLELTYGASARVVPHEVRNQWWSDLRQIDLISIWDPANSRQQNDQDRLEFSGDVPDQYVVSEPVGQWSARMQRITTLGADPDLAEYSLPRLDRKVFQQWYKSLKSPSAKSPVPPSPGTIIGITVPGKPVQWSLSAEHQNAQTRLSRVAALLNEVLTAGWEKQSGIFYVLRELSPTAGPDCEDLVCGSHPTGLVLQEVEPGRFLLTRTVFPTWE